MQKVVFVGPSINSHGGIGAIIKELKDSRLKELCCIYVIETFIESSKFRKLMMFAGSMIKLIYCLIFGSVDLVHIHSASRASFYRKTFFLIVSKMFGKKVIFHLYGAEFLIFYNDESRLLKKRYIESVLRLSDLVIVPSKALQVEINRICKGKETIILMNPVNLNDFDGDFEVSSTPDLPNTYFNILFMANLIRRKGIYDLLYCVNDIVSGIKNARFVLAGDKRITDFDEICEREGIEDYVEFHGWVKGKSKIDCFREADLAVLPSYDEALPVTISEAMAAGLPVVSTKVAGIPDVVEDGVNGFLIDPGDRAEFVKKVVRLADDFDLRKKMGLENKKKAKLLFDRDIVGMKLKNLYDELLKE